MNDTRLRWTTQALLAVVPSGLALLAALVVRAHVERTPYFIFLPAVMLSGWYGGRTAGLGATASSLLLIDYFVLEPHFAISRGIDDVVLLTLFAVVSVSVAFLMARWQRADIEREAALREAEHARQEAEQIGRLKDQFLATLSHELRTPLNAVLGWASVLVSGRLEPDKIPGALATIQRNAQAQKQLVDDLLDTSAIMTGRLRLEPGPIDLADVSRSAVDAVRLSIDARRQRLDQHLEPVRTIGDATRLRQVIWNLLSNAVKFTPEGGTIELRIERNADEARITVRDSGRGIAPEFLPHVFDPFRQADSSITRVSGGLGLGLALVRHLIETHGGRVWAESEGPGRGATFTACLPIGLLAAGAAEATILANAPGGAPATGALDREREPLTLTLSSTSSPELPRGSS